MLKISHKMVFFDRQIILNRNPKVRKQFWAKVNQTPIHKAGMLVRRIAVNSIRRRKSGKPSPPGQPPRSQERGQKRSNVPPFKQIYSVPDYWQTSTMVGMIGYSSSGTPVPALHEYGLSDRRMVRVARKQQSDRRDKSGRFIQGFKERYDLVAKVVKYPKRPFMAPALEKAKSKLPALWQNSVRSA